MPTGTLWALCSSSASSLSSLPNSKPSPPPPQGNHPHPTQLTERPDHTSGLPSNPRAPLPHTVISNGAGRLFLPHSLLRMRRPAQREISLPLSLLRPHRHQFLHRRWPRHHAPLLRPQRPLPLQKTPRLLLPRPSGQRPVFGPVLLPLGSHESH